MNVLSHVQTEKLKSSWLKLCACVLQFDAVMKTQHSFIRFLSECCFRLTCSRRTTKQLQPRTYHFERCYINVKWKVLWEQVLIRKMNE